MAERPRIHALIAQPLLLARIVAFVGTKETSTLGTCLALVSALQAAAMHRGAAVLQKERYMELMSLVCCLCCSWGNQCSSAAHGRESL